MADPEPLTTDQVNTLFDVLSHYETYSEIEDFKSPQTIHEYGPPFQDNQKSATPILQILLSKFVTQLPGLKDVSPDFWKVRLQTIIEKLSAAELSESYDKGMLGIRKTLATAISALIEYPARACLGGFPKNKSSLETRDYDTTNGDDVVQAWQDFLQQLVYGDRWDTLFAKATETDDLSKHDSLTRAAHEFVVVNLASFLHYTLILSPEGPSLLRMVENLNKLAPYTLIRQTLRVGNVATMISGMMRLLLAKLSIASITNWFGVSSGADEGMNLLQQIMSTVLGWDKKELKKRIERIEKDKDAPSKEVRDALKDWTDASRDEHLACRNGSKEQKMSIVAVILSLSPASDEMTEKQHSNALEYLSLQLALRDRRKIIDVLCNNNPDHLTEAIRNCVSAYEPMIRQVHQAVDLSATVGDLQAFMDDMIKTGKSKTEGGKTTPPSVEDFVKLLHTHQGASHRFINQVAKNGREVTQWFNDYAHEASKHFQSSSSPISARLAESFTALPTDQQSQIRTELDNHAKYLTDLHDSSAARIRDVISNTTTTKSSTPYGPGAYLARWQQLLDSTLVTPATAEGPLRKGASRSVRAESSKDVDGEVSEDVGVSEARKEKVVKDVTPEAPSTEVTIKALGPRFKELLREL